MSCFANKVMDLQVDLTDHKTSLDVLVTALQAAVANTYDHGNFDDAIVVAQTIQGVAADLVTSVEAALAEPLPT